MGLCSRRKKDSQNPDEVTITCFGGKKKGKKVACSGILLEAEALIKDLRQEVKDLRHAQTGISDDSRKFADEKEKLLDERGRLREELAGLKVELRMLEQRGNIVSKENESLRERTLELTRDMETAREEHEQTARMAEGMKVKCRDSQASLERVKDVLELRTSELKTTLERCDASQSEVERLSKELSNLDLYKVMADKTLEARVDTLRKKYCHLKQICRGKDVIIQQLKEERSNALMQLWQSTYGESSPEFRLQTPGSSPRYKQHIPSARIEPFNTDVISVCTASSPQKHMDTMPSEFHKNKTMLMEFELYRKRIETEIFDDLSPQNSSTDMVTGGHKHEVGSVVTGSPRHHAGSDVTGVSHYVNSFLDSLIERREATSCLGSVSSEMVL